MEMLFFFNPVPMGDFMFSIIGFALSLFLLALIVGTILFVALFVAGGLSALYYEIYMWRKKMRRAKKRK